MSGQRLKRTLSATPRAPAGIDNECASRALILANFDIQERHGHRVLFEQPAPTVNGSGPFAWSVSRRIGAQMQHHCWPSAVAEPSLGVRVVEPRFYHRGCRSIAVRHPRTDALTLQSRYRR